MLKKKIHEIARIPKSKFEKTLELAWVWLKKEIRLMEVDLFFYQPEGSNRKIKKVDEVIHIVKIIALVIVAWSVLTGR